MRGAEEGGAEEGGGGAAGGTGMLAALVILVLLFGPVVVRRGLPARAIRAINTGRAIRAVNTGISAPDDVGARTVRAGRWGQGQRTVGGRLASRLRRAAATCSLATSSTARWSAPCSNSTISRCSRTTPSR